MGKSGTAGEHWCTLNKVSEENKFYLPARGRGELFINGTHYAMEKGKWFLIGSEDSRSYYTTGCDEFAHHAVHFYGEADAKSIKEALDLPDFIELTEEEYQKAYDLMTKIDFVNPQTPTNLYELFSNKSKVYNILAYYCELAAKKGLCKSDHSDETSHIRYMIFEYIKTEGVKNISAKNLALTLGMNEGYFLKYFKKLFYISLHQLIFKLRMLKCFWRLVDSPYSIKEIAESCGFSSMSHFIKMFKEQTGTTPLVFRNKYFDSAFSSSFIIVPSANKKH